MSSKKGKQPAMKKPKLQKPAPISKQPAHKHSMQLKEWAEMMTNPKDHECVRTPSEFATVADIKTFTRVFPLTAAASPNGNFAMVATPTIENFFSLTSAVGITSPNPMTAASNGAVNFPQTSGTNAIEMTGTFAIYDDVTSVLLGATETNLYQSKEAIVVKTPAGGACLMTINNGSAGCTYSIFYWDPVLAAWVAGPVVVAQPRSINPVPFVPANGMNAVVLVCSRLGNAGVAVSLQTPNGSAFNAQTQTYDLFDSDAIQLGKVERYRITALSLLASYSGNQFNDGGVIAAARCQPNFTFGEDPYVSLTKLIDHEKHGPMKDGAYVWWLPNSFAEREFIAFGQESQLATATNLRIAGNFSDPLGSLQITITVVVEFYSPLQIFNHNIGPVVNDEFYEALHALDTLPAATCNPLHTDILDALKAGAKHAFEFAVKNPALVLAAAKSISSML